MSIFAGSGRIDLVSPLPRAECARRIKAVADGWWKLIGTRPATGWISDTSIRLRKRIWYGNSFQTYLFGKLEDYEGGTVIRCRFGMHPFVIAFMSFWFAGAAIGGGVILLGTLVQLIKYREPFSLPMLLGIVVPFALLAGGAALLRFGRYLARDERQFLKDFVCAAINAREMQTDIPRRRTTDR